MLPWVEPQRASARRRACCTSAVPAGLLRAGPGRAFARLVKIMLERGLNLHDPRYIGHQVPAPVPLAGLFDAVGSVTNQVMAIYEMGPWSTAVEQAMIGELGAAIGWEPDTFAGAVTHGGSLANLTALLTARNVALGGGMGARAGRLGARPAAGGARRRPVLLAHAEAHYSVARAAGILGLGSRQVVRVGLDERGRMDPALLDEELDPSPGAGQPVVAVVACACATPTGAFDPLNEIADVCAEHERLAARRCGARRRGRSERPAPASGGRSRTGGQRRLGRPQDALRARTLCFRLLPRQGQPLRGVPAGCPYLFDPAAPGPGRVRQRHEDGGMHQAGGGVRPVGRLVAVRAAAVRRHGRRDLRPGPRVLREAAGGRRFRAAARAGVQHRGLPPRARPRCATPPPSGSATSSSSCGGASSSRASSTSSPSSAMASAPSA